MAEAYRVEGDLSKGALVNNKSWGGLAAKRFSPPQDLLCTNHILYFPARMSHEPSPLAREVAMPSFALPAVPPGTRLEVLQVGAAPLIRHFLELLDLPGLLERHLPV
jgi:hypothetical protein